MCFGERGQETNSSEASHGSPSTRSTVPQCASTVYIPPCRCQGCSCMPLKPNQRYAIRGNILCNMEVCNMAQGTATKARDERGPEFREALGTEEQCRSEHITARWLGGFSGPSCSHHRHGKIGRGRLLLCSRRRKHAFPTEGIIFHSSNLALIAWWWCGLPDAR